MSFVFLEKVFVCCCILRSLKIPPDTEHIFLNLTACQTTVSSHHYTMDCEHASPDCNGRSLARPGMLKGGARRIQESHEGWHHELDNQRSNCDLLTVQSNIRVIHVVPSLRLLGNL